MRLQLMLGAALLLQAAEPRAPTDYRAFEYLRGVNVSAGEAAVACAPLDAAIYAHGQATLADLRLRTGPPGGQAEEVPYALTLSEAALTADPATVLNRGVSGHHITFDLAMPARPYTHVNLDLQAKNFVVNAKVTGGRGAGAAGGTYLGVFTLFDLSAQSLARDTVLPLSESTFPYLHVDLEVISGTLEPGMVHAADVPPSREAQTIYTTVDQTAAFAQRGTKTVASFNIPARIPVERVSFDLALGAAANFSRAVSVRARAQANSGSGEGAMDEVVAGEISRVKMTEHGQALSQESLSVAAIVGSNAQAAATVEVTIENGDDRPLALRAVRLEMRERRLCFDVPATGAVTLAYGDTTLRAPVYDYSRTFNPAAPVRVAALQPERVNPQYQPEVVVRPFTERHPALVWVALLAVVVVLGWMAVRSARRIV